MKKQMNPVKVLDQIYQEIIGVELSKNSLIKTVGIDNDNDSGSMIITMKDGTEWILSSKDIRPCSEE